MRRWFGTVLGLAACGRLGFDSDDPNMPPVTSGLVASYSMEDDPSGGMVEDRTGNGHTARCDPGTCPSTAPGRRGTGLAFDGVSQFLRVTDAPALDNPTGFTIAAWVFLDRQTENHTAIAKEFGTGADDTFNLMMKTVGACMEWSTPTEQNQVACAGDTPIIGRWVHMMQMWSGTTLSLLIDGAPAIVRELGEDIAFDNHDVVIGSDENSGEPARFWPGVIDDVHIFDRPLDAAEIAALVR